MAHQHFYSRVPARISMYNKADGFDTFAHSAALEREFIIRELYTVCENKLSKADADKARLGELPTVYLQTPLRSGAIVQTAITYISHDYTGERSSYLAHSLIIEDSERQALFASNDNAPFNKDMFVCDISVFNVTAPDSAPRSDYDTLAYSPAPAADTSEIAGKYDEEILQRFMYATLSALTGKGKTVYFHLPYPDAELSDRALDFINAIMAVLPYRLREDISFVTYIGNVTAYPTFKFKCTSGECMEIPQSKGAFFDFESGLVTGVTDSELSKNISVVSFFTDLLSSPNVREEFLAYEYEAERLLGLKSLSFKTLCDLVFLFTKCAESASAYSEISSDDELYEFFCLYEKYREAMPAHYRTAVYRTLSRYPERHLPIPKTVFSKLTRLYPAEEGSARRTALNCVLELIHTDLMRDKLFAFIKNNYSSESSDVKELICDDLCRVFYGGFLQGQIIDFFSQSFDSEPDVTKNTIIEKLLLSVRTESVQKKILAFLDSHYDSMTTASREAFYKTCFEMLPECDSLATAMTELVNSHIAKESIEYRNGVKAHMAELLASDLKSSEYKLLPILDGASGFSQDTLLELIFASQSAFSAAGEYLSLTKEKSAENKALTLVRACAVCKDTASATYDKLVSDLAPSFGAHTLSELMSADRVCEHAMPDKYLQKLRSTVLYPAIIAKMYDAFELGRRGSVDAFVDFAKDKKALKNAPSYAVIENYLELVSRALADDARGSATALRRLPQDEELRRSIGSYIRARDIKKEAQSDTASLILTLCSGFLSGDMDISLLYDEYKKSFVQAYNIENGAKANQSKAQKWASERSASLLLSTLSDISSACSAFESELCSKSSGLSAVISAFISDCGQSASKLLISVTESSNEQLRAYVNDVIKTQKSSPLGILSRLFSKK